MHRFHARVSSLALSFALCAAIAPSVAHAQTPLSPNFWFAGTRLVFDHATPLEDDFAISTRDSGLQKLLTRVGATLSYQPQQRYVIITSSDRRVITFVVADTRYTVGNVAAKATFAPFIDGGDVIVPLLAIARALYLEPVQNAGETVLEPQIGALDVRPDGRRTVLTFRGATALRYTKVSETPERLQLTFTGTASTLAQARRMGGGITEVDVLSGGTPRNPIVTVTIEAPRGTQHLIASGEPASEFTVVFGPPGVALDLHGTSGGTVAAAPAPPTPTATAGPGETHAAAPPTPPPYSAPSTQPQSGSAVITNIAIDPNDDGIAVRLNVNGSATYDWHRLLDNRWYIDVHNASLTGAGRDERPNSTSVDSVRIRQTGTADAPNVRIAFTLKGDRRVEVTPSENALTIAVSNLNESNLARTGNGQIGTGALAQNSDQLPAGPLNPPVASQPEGAPWKYNASGPGSRLIVIDPGHGGGDAGTSHNGLVEKTLTLDIARRLRGLLVQQGWSVKLTREGDTDPLSPDTMAQFQSDGKPNASDRAYLQTRCDVANNNNARMFISIHVNYAPSAAVSGTTIYYTKAQDAPLAQALERSLIPAIGTKDDGVIKANYYVTKHTSMPAVLIETAFISNAGDVAILSDPRSLQNMAVGIAAGVRAYVGSLPTVSSRTDQ
ncbi:MAG: hypothetical protein NVS2B17_32750 [Candidatus Velthaea sp.]